jgi:hypothetical protein
MFVRPMVDAARQHELHLWATAATGPSSAGAIATKRGSIRPYRRRAAKTDCPIGIASGFNRQIQPAFTRFNACQRSAPRHISMFSPPAGCQARAMFGAAIQFLCPPESAHH